MKLFKYIQSILLNRGHITVEIENSIGRLIYLKKILSIHVIRPFVIARM